MQRLIALGKAWGSRPSERRATAIVTAVVILAVHALTLTISPPVWQDEVQIVDLGRHALQPSDNTWSLNWTSSGRPIAFVNYLGPVIQELAYRVTAPSPAGPRTSTIIGALLAAAFAYAWIRTLGIPVLSAWLWSIVLVLDPQFVAVYRGARVDSWVFAFMFAACWAARRGRGREGRSALTSWRYFAGAGLLAGIAFFVWPSAIFLFPLLFADLVDGSKDVPRRALARRLALVVAGGIVAGVLCLLPVMGELGVVLRDLFASKEANSVPGTLSTRILTGLRALPMAFKVSPILPLLALGAIAFRRNIPFAIAAATTIALMLPTQIYAGRVIYLLPYMLVLVAQAGEELRTSRPQTSWRRLRAGAFILALSWAVGLSMVARPLNAWSGRKARDPELISTAAEHLLPPGHPRVFLGSWEFYYAGRAIGWEMFVPYGRFSTAESLQLNRTLDAAIVYVKAPPSVTDPLVAAGLERSREIQVATGGDFNPNALRGAGFGTYVLYTRPTNH